MQVTKIAPAADVSAATATQPHSRPWRISIILLYAFALGVVAAIIWRAHGFYLTPYTERPLHEDYRAFRPAGSFGLTFGIIGTCMMLLMLLYSLRKRVRWLRKLGLLSRWLDVHIFFGIIGPLFIVLHTSFKVQGLVAVSFWSMVAVSLSGFFGRYVFRQIPRNLQGEQLSFDQIEQLNTELTTRLKRDFSLSDQVLNELDKLSSVSTSSRGFLAFFAASIKDDLTSGAKGRQIERLIMKSALIPSTERKLIVELAQQRRLLQRRLQLLSYAHRLFHYWHVIHKPFAIIMYIVMFVHIGVAIWTGYVPWLKL